MKRLICLFALIGSLQAFQIFTKKDSCMGQCTSEYFPNNACQCNPECESHGNCCSDYENACKSCQGRCGQGLNANYPCQCNQQCKDYNDCCNNYDQICNGGGGEVTDSDLLDISEKLFALASQDFQVEFYLDFGGKINQGQTQDMSPERLIYVDEAGLESYDSIRTFLPLMDNYDPDVKKAEDRTAEEQAEENEFIESIMKTRILQETLDFLSSKNVVGNADDFKLKLKELWFELYDRDGTNNHVLDSSGFEHVFVGESKNNQVTGFHGWINFYLQEIAGNLNYFGYLNKKDFGSNFYGVTNVFEWNGEMKPIGGGFLGTPPELDLALFTICSLTRSEKDCHMAFEGQAFYIKAFASISNGHQNIGSAYPVFD